MEGPRLPTNVKDLQDSLQDYFAYCTASAPVERYVVILRPDDCGANPYHISGSDVVLAATPCEAFLRVCVAARDIIPFDDQDAYDRLLSELEDRGYDELSFEGLAEALVESYYGSQLSPYLQTIHVQRLSYLLEQAPIAKTQFPSD